MTKFRYKNGNLKKKKGTAFRLLRSFVVSESEISPCRPPTAKTMIEQLGGKDRIRKQKERERESTKEERKETEGGKERRE